MRSNCRSFLLLMLGATAAGLGMSASVWAENSPSMAKIGQTIENVALKDGTGKAVSLYDFKGKKATVVVFLSFECPVSKGYSQPLVELAKAYSDVAFIGLSSNESESAAEVAKHAEEFKLSFPTLKDERHAAADAFKAEMTPEAFLLDANQVLRYRGRIDNAYAARLRKNNQTTRHDLRKALDELLAGKPVSEPATQAVGCPLVRSKDVQVAKNDVTFYRDVLPILQNNCQTCHRPGEVGPFSLMTYRQAANWAADIKDFTQSRKMPPWKPSEGPAFHNERKLTDKDIVTLVTWLDHNTPEGNPKDAPPPKKFTSGWQLGEPDLVLTVSSDFTLGATGNDLFRCFVLPTSLAEDKYVTAMEVRPGNPRIVHHILTAVDTTGQGRKLEQTEKDKGKAKEIDNGPGYPVAMGFGFVPQGALGGWAPGQIGRHLPEGTGYFLPKGSDVVIQVHYHRDGRVEKDHCTLGLYFAKKPVEKRFQSLVLPGRFLAIPAGDPAFHVQGKIWVDQDCTIYSVLPHMHMVGKQIKVTVTPPDGSQQTLVAIKDWDYNWQETYMFKEPIHVKAGTRFEVEAFYDNSEGNPNNPSSPPRQVIFGQQTTDEMCFVFFGATPDKPGRLRPRFDASRSRSEPVKSEPLKKP